MDYVILMDAAGDIDSEIAAKNNIFFIPMNYTIGEEMRSCSGPEPDEILKKFYDGQRSGDLTQTSQIPPYQYEAVLKDFFKDGKSVLYLCLSGGLSGTFQSANIAKQELMEKYPDCAFYPVDTLGATGGMGVLAERAIRNRENGMSIEENYENLTAAVKCIKHWFVVDDLMYLKRGGRISAAAAVVGSTLNLKPILTINELGKLDTIAKKRGEKAAIKELVTRFKDEYDPASGDVIYVVHADSMEKAEKLHDQVKELYPESEVRISGLSPIIGAHTGPGMAAVCFMGK